MENKGNWKLAGFFLGGVIAGVTGARLARTEKARKLLVETTAALLRAKDTALENGTEVQATAEDIVAEAKELNRKREEAAAAEAKE